MTDLKATLQTYVRSGSLPGAVTLLARGEDVEVQAVGRLGLDDGTGTSAHLIPSSGTVAILLTQVGVTSPAPTPLLLDFWRHAAAF